MKYIAQDGREFADYNKLLVHEHKLLLRANQPDKKIQLKGYIQERIGSEKQYKHKHYCAYLTSAFKKNIPFEFTLDEFYTFINQPCTYCGHPGPGGIDRIDCKVGYIKSNCTPACKTCNLMKYTLSTDEFYKHISKILDFSKR